MHITLQPALSSSSCCLRLPPLLSPTQTKVPAPKCTVIDGKETAAAIRKELKVELDQMKSTAASPDFVVPGLAVILVGARPDSATYVRMKSKACEEIGYKSIQTGDMCEVRVRWTRLLYTKRPSSKHPLVTSYLLSKRKFFTVHLEDKLVLPSTSVTSLSLLIVVSVRGLIGMASFITAVY